MLTFICGGVRSGKSSWGEDYAEKLQAGGRLIYIATARTTDSEMKKRIDLHKKERQLRSDAWLTIEQSKRLDVCAKSISKNDIIFLDCLTTWLSNEVFSDVEPPQLSSVVKDRVKSAVSVLEDACSHLIIISNDLFQEPIPESEQVYRYIKILGELHQYFTDQAELAVKMEYGIPVVMKGEVPNERSDGLGDNLRCR
ncbi:bifunctional adenosylcobinamide kinase/adenosylcobinamide-phosphate guanylyltransferase [Alteribacillus sp. JSM 102045]|uniref:bifunctional adenosylcobinamide kinase/adenosylcobinamide-phosphate guanylyltransferase n=1 Tax=Alteribacillus sp. JSM 102045 TaxID=1562101 RepID=UPI0035C157C1